MLNLFWKHKSIFLYPFYLSRVLAFRYCRCLHVCPWICPSVHQPFACLRDDLWPIDQARITEFGPNVQSTLVKIPIVFGGDWPWPSKSNLMPSFTNRITLSTKKKKLKKDHEAVSTLCMYTDQGSHCNFDCTIFKCIILIDIFQGCPVELHWNGCYRTLWIRWYWCRQWLGAIRQRSHYLKECWPNSLMPYDITRGHWVQWQSLCE